MKTEEKIERFWRVSRRERKKETNEGDLLRVTAAKIWKEEKKDQKIWKLGGEFSLTRQGERERVRGRDGRKKTNGKTRKKKQREGFGWKTEKKENKQAETEGLRLRKENKQ